VSNSTCAGTINASANCTVSFTFSPLASGIRSATWTVTDDAPNSPQAVSLSGSSLPALALSAAASGGNTSATVSAGQSAQFNLQAAPGEGFSGSLTLTCSGSPQGAACKVPSGVTVSNSSPTNFTVTVTTSGNSSWIPVAPEFPQNPLSGLRVISTLFAVLFLLLLLDRFLRARRARFALAFLQLAALASLLIAIGLNGCGGGSSPSGQTTASNPPPVVVTPFGTYILTLTPTATPTGSTKQFNLNPIQLTLIVK